MKIEVWSDYVCPFCYIGKRRLEQALEQFDHANEVEVEFKSFELDPNFPKDTDKNIHQLIASKYGITEEQARNNSVSLTQQAAAVGLDFRFDTSVPTNTFDAHRLTKFAQTKGKAAELTELLLKAHFTDSKHVGDEATLLDLGESVGLDRNEAAEVLKGEAYAKEVRIDEAEAREIGVQGVPFFVINRKYAISGAQPPEVFRDALEKVWQEESRSPLTSLNTDQGMTCDENGCEIPEEK